MKKILLGTSALVLFAGAAAAQQVTTKAPFVVTLGGSVRSDFFVFSDDVADSNSREARIDYRLHLKAEAKAENGLTYGFNARLRNNVGSGGINSAQANQDTLGADRKFVYLGGSWGRIELGDADSIPTNFELPAPFVFSTADVGAGTSFGQHSYYFYGEGSFHTKVAYYTPNFAGFQAAVSWTPEQDSRGRDNTRSKYVTGSGNNYRDVFALGASYTGKFSDIGLKVSGAFETGETKKISALVNNSKGDYQLWFLGAQASYAGFTFGGWYFDNGETNLNKGDDQDGWSVGVKYETGPWGVGINYSVVDTDRAARNARDTSDSIISLGAGYTLAPGLNLQADVAKLNIESATGLKPGKSKNDGTQFTFRTRLDF